jgi:hypothetical protein
MASPELLILGNLALVCVIVANVLVYAVKGAIRKKGYPVSWISYPGMHNDFASLRKIIAAAQSTEEMLRYRRWQRRLYLSYVVFGLGVALLFVVWIDWAFHS